MAGETVKPNGIYINGNNFDTRLVDIQFQFDCNVYSWKESENSMHHLKSIETIFSYLGKCLENII